MQAVRGQARLRMECEHSANHRWRFVLFLSETRNRLAYIALPQALGSWLRNASSL